MPLDYSDLTPFQKGYVEAMFWTDASPDAEADLKDKTISDLSQDAINRILTDCTRFEDYAADLLALAYANDYPEERAGHDFWLTRNGHGAGFWDRDELMAEGLGDRLSKRARKFGQVGLYVGDDGKVYLQ